MRLSSNGPCRRFGIRGVDFLTSCTLQRFVVLEGRIADVNDDARLADEKGTW